MSKETNDLFESQELSDYNNWWNYMHLAEIEYPELHICKISMGWKPLFEATKFYGNVKELKEFYNKNKDRIHIEDEYVCDYKNLGEQYILSAKVHMDEETPHMHLVFIPVVHTQDKKGNNIDKIACSEFWKEKDSYRQLQNAFYNYMVSNNFELERGLQKEETGREHIDLKEYKEKEFNIEWKYKSKIKGLEKENSHLHKIIDKFYDTIDKFIHWICEKFDMGAEDSLIRDFQKETNTLLDAEKQIEHEAIEKEWDLERQS